jgi:hypothetical protein
MPILICPVPLPSDTDPKITAFVTYKQAHWPDLTGILAATI